MPGADIVCFINFRHLAAVVCRSLRGIVRWGSPQFATEPTTRGKKCKRLFWFSRLAWKPELFVANGNEDQQYDSQNLPLWARSLQPIHLWPTSYPDTLKDNSVGVSRVSGGWLSLVKAAVLSTFNLKPTSPRKNTRMSINSATSEWVQANRRISFANRKFNIYGSPSPKSKPTLRMWHLNFFIGVYKSEQSSAAAPLYQNFVRLVEIKHL